MRPLTYEERRALAVRVAIGIEHECKRSHRGLVTEMAHIAEALETSEHVLRALQNPAIKSPPAMHVRAALERISKRWPGGAIFSGEWLGIAKGEGEQQELADVAGAAERAERRAGAA